MPGVLSPDAGVSKGSEVISSASDASIGTSVSSEIRSNVGVNPQGALEKFSLGEVSKRLDAIKADLSQNEGSVAGDGRPISVDSGNQKIGEAATSTGTKNESPGQLPPVDQNLTKNEEGQFSYAAGMEPGGTNTPQEAPATYQDLVNNTAEMGSATIPPVTDGGAREDSGIPAEASVSSAGEPQDKGKVEANGQASNQSPNAAAESVSPNSPTVKGERISGTMSNDTATDYLGDDAVRRPDGAESPKATSTAEQQKSEADRSARKAEVEARLQALESKALSDHLTPAELADVETLGREYQQLNSDPQELKRQAFERAKNGGMTPEDKSNLMSNEATKQVDPGEAYQQAEDQIAALYEQIDNPNTTPEQEVELANQMQEIADKTAGIRRTKEEKERYRQQAKDFLNPDENRLAKLSQKERALQKDIRDKIMQLRAAEKRLKTQKERVDQLVGDYRKKAAELRPMTAYKLEDMSPEQRDQAYEKYLELNAIKSRLEVTAREGEIIRRERSDTMQYVRRKLGVTHGLSAMLECVGTKIDNKLDEINSAIRDKIGLSEYATWQQYFNPRG